MVATRWRECQSLHVRVHLPGSCEGLDGVGVIVTRIRDRPAVRNDVMSEVQREEIRTLKNAFGAQG